MSSTTESARRDKQIQSASAPIPSEESARRRNKLLWPKMRHTRTACASLISAAREARPSIVSLVCDTIGRILPLRRAIATRTRSGRLGSISLWDVLGAATQSGRPLRHAFVVRRLSELGRRSLDRFIIGNASESERSGSERVLIKSDQPSAGSWQLRPAES